MRHLAVIAFRLFLLGSCCVAAVVSFPSLHAEEGSQFGEQIYVAKCAVCHGPSGKGTEKHASRLAGDLSVPQLAKQIQQTMPEDDPGSLTDDQARSVAEYVHGAFYSSIARARNQPARVGLARLTVGQHRHAVADLVASFRGQVPLDDKRGIKGEYFRGRRIGGRKERVAERIDAELDFDFGTGTPLSELKDPHVFSIRWSGAILASETGDYELVVRTNHAARLWINDLSQPLVDALVKSGDDTEYRASRFLLGGHVYPVRLEFSKATQGVKDPKKHKTPEHAEPASIALLWRRPQGELEPIPSRQLSPHTPSEVFVCATPFPPDDRSYGWERGTRVSKAWSDATTEAAIDTAGYVAAHMNELAGTRDGDAKQSQKLRLFCQTFAERAFRRPLDETAIETYVGRQFQASENLETAVKRVVLLVLKSPRFLFRETGGPDQFDVASRLSFALWDSIPDKELLTAAGEGRLITKDQVAQQAERMLGDIRAKTKLHECLLSWLKVDSAEEVRKDEERFPEFDSRVIADLRTSLEMFLDQVVWSEGSDFRRLLLADEVLLNERLAKAYGVQETMGTGFANVRLDEGKRAGVLTHPYLMAHFADGKESSPIHRGVFLARGVLGQALKPPPQAVTPLAPDLHPELSTRDRVTLQTSAANCMTCHGIINPLGFTLERFDAVGRFRELDRGKPVDDSGGYTTPAGETQTINGARELAEFVANSRVSHRAFVEILFQHLVQQSVNAYGAKTLESLTDAFAAHDFNIRKLVVEVMVASAPIGHNSGIDLHLKPAAK